MGLIEYDWGAFGIENDATVDSHVVDNVEGCLNRKLPASYLNLMFFSKSPSPELGCFEYDEGGTAISEFFEFSSEIRPYTICWYARERGVDGLPTGLVPVARDAGDYLICLNFETTEPSVVLFDPHSKRVFRVAESFSAFVEMWHE